MKRTAIHGFLAVCITALIASCGQAVIPGIEDSGSKGGGSGKGGGSPHDSGSAGGGSEEVDAGFDAGEPQPVDAGVDAGTDAGVIDAGIPEAGPGESICGDGLDNDHDGLIDCLDPDCAAQLCRGALGTCDLPEVCTNNLCPPDAFKLSAVICRASAGDCDVEERCTGAAATCPGDLMRSGGVTCRASTGVCDPAETCDGLTPTCAADAMLPSTSVCRSSAGSCDLEEKCTGTTAACPADALAPASTTCRAASGVCDVEETCSGTAPTCPSDGFVAAGSLCRAVADVCDLPEACTGGSAACPAEQFKASGTVCRSAAGVCDKVEQCTGNAAACPADAMQPSTTLCHAAACSLSASTPNTFCGGGTDCPVPAPTPCSNGAYVCRDATACYTSCTNDSACGYTFFCTADPFGGGGNDCAPKKVDGTACSTPSQCTSGVCNQYWLDADHDGFTTTSSFRCGSTAPANYRAIQHGLDCDDNAVNTFPGQTTFFKTPRVNGTFDYDCSGAEDREIVALGGCAGVTCGFPGPSWIGNLVPPCGWQSQLLTSCSFGFSCNYTSVTAIQGCH